MNIFIKVVIAILLLKNSFVFAQIPEIKTDASGVKFYEEARFKKGEINKPFYYIRHGETDVNKHNIAPENLDVSLNEEGKAQAQEAVKVLRDKNIKIIVASPLIRTKQTAEIISKELNVPILYDDGLKELNIGYVKGENMKLSKKNEIWKSGGEVAGAESLYLFQERIHKTIKEVVNKYDDVLIVSHAGYFSQLSILLNEDKLKTKNAIPFFFSPISRNTGKELYKITPLM